MYAMTIAYLLFLIAAIAGLWNYSAFVTVLAIASIPMAYAYYKAGIEKKNYKLCAFGISTPIFLIPYAALVFNNWVIAYPIGYILFAAFIIWHMVAMFMYAEEYELPMFYAAAWPITLGLVLIPISQLLNIWIKLPLMTYITMGLLIYGLILAIIALRKI